MTTPEEITSTMNARIEAIRRQDELTPVAKRARIAAAYKPAKAEMAQLESAAREARASTKLKATQTAFGVADLAKTPGDAALVSMAFRQAADRVAAITDAADAAKLLEQATTSGDETLARAVAQHADQMTQHALADPAWMDLLNSYAVPRPAQFKAIEEIHASRRGGPLAGVFEFALVPPSELGNASDFDVERMIAEDPTAVAQAGVS